ncbi:thioredoxin family protein [Cohnella nanjingensis]|uniref:Thioredoxin family protein n=1 Tax=Cohnella nanjingensis TaxID=1387779 RepID=A0A7X0VFZ8_9BACL|nr:thioredoxin family protein [Cohnella nanjingensis]MBB6672577.1 thioredoxin family protein [Cohnella nanjingensis]
MSQQLGHKLNQGISPRQFMDGMEKNKEAFAANYEQFAWPDDKLREFFESLNNRDDLRSMIITADWCGDALRSVPVIFRALETAGIATEVMIIEQHYDLLDQHLTLGGRSIPIVLFTDTGGHLLGKWGPRPQHVQDVMVAFKEANPDREAPTYEDNMAAARREIVQQYGDASDYTPVILWELQDILERA